MNIEILGCGVAGLCTATELAKNNVKIDLVDPNGGPTEKSCSWWAGGMLAPDCEGETAPDIVVS
ncbi:MAG: FAD-dependent oxidoreductase, partial [Woeseia sp.]|nr:FAD-dependent oxidoreductase [Woeseia sp.]